MYRSALLILSGNAFASVLLLARSLIVARLISVEDYGIAATFAVSMAVVEMMSALGLQQQIVQARDGNDPRLQAGLQGFQLLRGMISGAVLFLIAGPVAWFLGIPQVTWAYQLLAVVPILNALVHFDVYRMNRAMVYLPGILTLAVPALFSVLIVWPLAAYLGDWRVMLYAILAQAVLGAITSHIVAKRPYRLLFDRSIMSQSLRFGWPLLANGILLFAVFNGEKLIVGRELGMSELAIFAMGITLTLTPTLVMARSVQSFFLPQLSALHKQGAAGREGFAHLANATIQAGIVNGTLLVVAVLFFGAPIVQALLGPKYEPLVALLTSLAIVQALRVFKTGSAVVALARGQTGNAMIANLFRVAVLPVAWIVLVQGGSLTEVIWIGTAGEFCGFVASLLLVRYRIGLPMGPMLLPLLASCAVLAIAGEDYVLQTFFAGSAATHWELAGLVVVLFIAMIASMTDLVRYISRRQTTNFEE